MDCFSYFSHSREGKTLSFRQINMVSPKGVDGMANSVDPDLDMHCCSDLSVPIFGIFSVYL